MLSRRAMVDSCLCNARMTVACGGRKRVKAIDITHRDRAAWMQVTGERLLGVVHATSQQDART